MAERSPKFPSVSLGEAIELIRMVYQREGRAKMPRLSAVKPLGYSSINGRSLSILGALRAYGLLEGRGDEVRVSEDAITILNAPQDSPERHEALVRSFEGPPPFALLRSKGDASADTLRWHLIKSNFRDEAADKLLKAFLDSRDFLNGVLGEAPAVENEEEETPKGINPFEDPVRPYFGATKPQQEQKPSQTRASHTEADVHERVLQSGMLSKTVTYRVIVSGSVGVPEIERLIKKLEMDKEILADPDSAPGSPLSG